MVHAYKPDDSYVAPAYAGRLGHAPVPKNRMPDAAALPEAVYRMIHDELLLDGMHPNDKGHAIVAERLLPAIRDQVR